MPPEALPQETEDEVQVDEDIGEQDDAESLGEGEGEGSEGTAGEDGGVAGDAGKGDDSGDETGEVVVTIGDETPEDESQKAPDWVRDLRKRQRETAKENRELKAKLEAMQTKPTTSDPGPRPTLEGHDYDTGRYESALDKWYAKKREADQAEARANAEREEQDRAWKSRLDAYGAAKSALKVPDYDDAEAIAQDALDQTQQGIIVQGAENPALVIYALGRNPQQLEKLRAIQDPVKFSFAVAKLEAKLKMTPRRPATQPEKTVTGTGSPSGAVDSTLDRLRAKAEKTGDYSEVTAYRRKKRQAARR